ncbi:hypothetical protein SteCoe_6524 [Stentor coeruleus]|uniref:TNFR-Cys domain-containing protein n=1 Tax=Stentor coeruleus TaxID=5963 RepID=A0A1R2CPX5_9CILI|nr:hypothetical protein SteCoe_6524 [Stentor coeruleus]
MIPRIIFILLSIFFEVYSVCCLNCISYSSTLCTSCSSPYSLYKYTCVNLCGKGYSLVDGKCTSDGTSLTLMSTTFYSEKNNAKTSVGEFQTEDGSPFINPGNFLPTMDRGFYSDQYSNLIGKNTYIPTTDFTFRLYFRPLSYDGTIFRGEYIEGNNFLEVEMVSGYLKANLLTKKQIDSQFSVIQTTNNYANRSDGKWFNALIEVWQQNEITVSLKIKLNEGTQTTTVTGNEIYISQISRWVLGDPNKLTTLAGFYYYLTTTNKVSMSQLSEYSLNTCDNNYFKDSVGNCVFCGVNCDPRVTCIDSSTCSQCLYVQCNSCDGYVMNTCDYCTNGVPAPVCCGFLCRDCNSIDTCNSCSIGMHMYLGVCLYFAPDGGDTPLTNPILEVNFDVPFIGSYGILRTGAYSTQYHIFGNPEKYDPIPSKNRGLYFNGTSYLKSSTNYYFPHVFSIALLVKPGQDASSNMVYISGAFVGQDSHSLMAAMIQEDDGSLIAYFSNQYPAFTDWRFLSYSAFYTYPDTTLVAYVNNIEIMRFTAKGVLRPNTGNIYIGSSSPVLTSSNVAFIGFIYSFYCWNYPITDFSAKSSFTICSTADEQGCIYNIGINEFFNETGVYNCLSTCKYGCVQGINCNICFSLLCSICPYFDDNCSQCIQNAILTLGKCSCISNRYQLYDSCEICHPLCSECISGYKNGCTSCSNTIHYLADGICMAQCPNGYIISGSVCIKSTSEILSLKLYNQEVYSTINGLFIGNSISSSIDINDPLPYQNRGYYFIPSNYIFGTQVMFYATFSIGLWAKIYSLGTILTYGGSIIVESDDSFVYMNIMLDNGNIAVVSCSYSRLWMYFYIENNVLSDGNSELKMYANSLLSGNILSSDFQSWSSGPLELVLGSKNTNGFTGFIWSLDIHSTTNKLYDFYTSSGCIGNCLSCPEILTCPSECDFGYPPICTITCGEGCFECITSTNCISCYPSAILSSGLCICPDRYSWNSTTNSCLFNCFDTCNSCNNINFDGCTSCKSPFNMQENVCVICSLGYKTENTVCVLEKELIFDIVFDSISGMVIDSASGFEGITGKSKSFYPDYDINDPIYAFFNRGYYFDEVSSYVVFKNIPNLFSPVFTFEAWIMADDYTGTLFTKQDSENYSQTFTVYFENSDLKLSLNIIPFGVMILPLLTKPISQEWNYIKITCKSLGKADFSISISLNSHDLLYTTTLSKSYISDIENSSITLGALLTQQGYKNYYKGFIWRITITSTLKNKNFINSCLDDCLSCDENLQCLPNCNINNYWLGGKYNNCTLCNKKCNKGCRDSRENCSLCNDLLCETCSDLNYCQKCVDGAELTLSQTCNCYSNHTIHYDYCELCPLGYVVINNICSPCKALCLSCDTFTCLLCTEHSSLQGNNCVCDLGYSGDENCTKVFFDVTCSASQSQILYIDFSDKLNNSLVEDDIKIVVQGKNVNFLLSKYSETRFALDLELYFDVKDGTVGIVYILQEVVSVHNGYMNNITLNCTLYGFKYSTKNILIEEYKAFAMSISEICIYITSSATIINPTPASLWSFVNTIQMLIFIYLAEIPFSDRFSGFLLGLRKYQIFPNFFQYMNLAHGSTNDLTRANKLGFTSNSVLVNIGKWISCFLFFIFLYFCMKNLYRLLEKTKYQKSFISKILLEKIKNYHYGFFLRFWIQAYIEVYVSCIIGFICSDLNKVDEALNFYLALLLGIVIILTPFVSYYLGLKKKNQGKNEVRTEMQVWASLFYEFKNDSKAASSQFYTVFFLRRGVFVTILFLLKSVPIIQICLCEILMISVRFMQMLFFILTKKPFNENALNIANCVSELGLAVIVLLIGVFLFDLKEHTQDQLDFVLIILVNIVVSSQLLASIYICGKVLLMKYKNWKHNKIRAENDEKEAKIFMQNLEVKKDLLTVEMYSKKTKINVTPIESCENSISGEKMFLTPIESCENSISGEKMFLTPISSVSIEDTIKNFNLK